MRLRCQRHAGQQHPAEGCGFQQTADTDISDRSKRGRRRRPCRIMTSKMALAEECATRDRSRIFHSLSCSSHSSSSSSVDLIERPTCDPGRIEATPIAAMILRRVREQCELVHRRNHNLPDLCLGKSGFLAAEICLLSLRLTGNPGAWRACAACAEVFSCVSNGIRN